MNDQLQVAFADILTKATSAVEAGAVFLSAELPEVVKQLLLWKMVQSAVAFAVWVAVTIAFLVGLGLLIKWAKNYKADDDGIQWVPVAGATAIGCFLLAVTFPGLDWLQIWLAPKVYLLQYAASLVTHK